MTGLGKILMILVMCLGTAELPSLSQGHEHHDLVEQGKQPLADNVSEGREWVEEKTGQYLPLDLAFVDERGETVRLGEIIDRPTLFLPIYFNCPDICSKNLANLANALSRLSFQPGGDFRVIALSFNEDENFEIAAQAKRNYLKIVGDSFPANEWFFLTGRREAIKAATDAVGFRFKRIVDSTFVHPAALMVIAGDGKIVRYVYGSFLAGDIDMALSSAKTGAVTQSVRRLLNFCFNYDPKTNQTVFQTVKIGILVLFGAGLAILWFSLRGRGKTGAGPNGSASLENRADRTATEEKQS